MASLLDDPDAVMQKMRVKQTQMPSYDEEILSAEWNPALSELRSWLNSSEEENAAPEEVQP